MAVAVHAAQETDAMVTGAKVRFDFWTRAEPLRGDLEGQIGGEVLALVAADAELD